MPHTNQHLTKPKQTKNNEYYTQFSDVENFFFNTVLKQDPNFFNNKIVVNFADTRESNIFLFFKQNLKKLGLKGIIRTQLTPAFNNFSNPHFLKTCDLVRSDGVINPVHWKGTSSIWENEYLENLEAIKKINPNLILISNPPFSNSRKTKDFLKNSKLPFFVISSTTWCSRYWPFEKLSCFKGPRYFLNPKNEKVEVCSYWWTNTKIKPDRKLPITTAAPYQIFNYNGQDVRIIDKMSNLTAEKNVFYGVPITFDLFDTSNWDEFENIFPIIDGKEIFSRILVRLKN